MNRILEDLTLHPGEPCAITGSGGKTTLLWYLAGIARRHAPVLVSVTAHMFPPAPGVVDQLCLNPDAWDPVSLTAGQIHLVARGLNDRGKLQGITEADVARLNQPGAYFLMEADGSRGLPLKMWHDHEPPVPSGARVTLGVLPIRLLGEPVSPENVYNWPDFSRVTGLAEGDLMTEEAFRRIVFHPQGLFKNSTGRRIVILNQCDSDQWLEQAQKLSLSLSRHPEASRLTAIACMSLEELNHENYRHYSCRRIIPADEPAKDQSVDQRT